MSGIRIHHPTERNCVLLIRHPGEIRRGFRTLNKGRKAKDYHIKLDNDGNCIVSETVWKRLEEAGANFIILNEVSAPPAQSLGFQENLETPAVKREINKAIHDIAPPGVVPRVVGLNG